MSRRYTASVLPHAAHHITSNLNNLLFDHRDQLLASAWKTCHFQLVSEVKKECEHNAKARLWSAMNYGWGSKSFTRTLKRTLEESLRLSSRNNASHLTAYEASAMQEWMKISKNEEALSFFRCQPSSSSFSFSSQEKVCRFYWVICVYIYIYIYTGNICWFVGHVFSVFFLLKRDI
jgi:hypothetical protein